MNANDLEFLYACRVIKTLLIQIRTARLAEMLCRVDKTLPHVSLEKLKEFEEMIPDVLSLAQNREMTLEYRDDKMKVDVRISWEKTP